MTRLQNDFVCGWRNIDGAEEYAGKSNAHDPSFPAVKTTNGAGAHNIQMLIISPEGKVVHCLPGYWSPSALEHELEFALELTKLLAKPGPANERNDAFMLKHLEHAYEHDFRITKNSKLQGFDEFRERAKEGSDFARHECNTSLKTVDQVIHERMAALPFLDLEDFDIAGFVAIGQKHYDAHSDGCSHGRKLGEGKKSE